VESYCGCKLYGIRTYIIYVIHMYAQIRYIYVRYICAQVESSSTPGDSIRKLDSIRKSVMLMVLPTHWSRHSRSFLKDVGEYRDRESWDKAGRFDLHDR